MNCPEFEARLWRHSEEAASGEERLEMDRHAEGCEVCTERLRVSLEITCREVAEFLDDYVDERLTAERRGVFERHLAACPDCISFLESYKKTTELAKGSLAEEPEQLPEMPEDLIRAILDARRRT